MLSRKSGDDGFAGIALEFEMRFAVVDQVRKASAIVGVINVGLYFIRLSQSLPSAT